MCDQPECVVCGRPRFMLEEEYCFDPLICNVECWMEFKTWLGEYEDVRNPKLFWQRDQVYHEEDNHTDNVYWMSNEPYTGD